MQPAVSVFAAGDPDSHVYLDELVSALSYALDLTEGQPPGHCLRCCWIGLNVATELGFSDEEKADLYYMILMKDLGCSSNAARICQLFATDDLKFKREHKIIGRSHADVLNFILRNTGLSSGLAERFRTLLAVAKDSKAISTELIDTRCHQGAEIAKIMRFSDRVCEGILDLDEHWNGGGLPQGKTGKEISLFARIALLAQVADVFFMEGGQEASRLEVKLRSGKWFDPEIAAAFANCAKEDGFWKGLQNPATAVRSFAVRHAFHKSAVDEDYLDDIARGFARVIDAKSPFTSGHSERVALYTDLICAELDYEPGYRRKMKRAALLHDVGKLGVSNAVLDKPDRLDDEEFAQIKKHPEFGEQILGRIDAFSDMAAIAATHHERLDGKGYPRGLDASVLTQDMRIVTVADIYDALTADRPYRAAMTYERAKGIMDDMVGSAIDPVCWEALQRGLTAAELNVADDA